MFQAKYIKPKNKLQRRKFFGMTAGEITTLQKLRQTKNFIVNVIVVKPYID
ncbi:MAG: hypothetical protein K6G55_01100 [Selenomonadaceae bacterium]|nr:hypothetical protein [Selenomonadaceae bacterium]